VETLLMILSENKYNIFVFSSVYISLSLIFWSMQVNLKKTTEALLKAMSSPRTKNQLKEEQDNTLKTVLFSLAWPIFIIKNLRDEFAKK
jgi:hypothetical protein